MEIFLFIVLIVLAGVILYTLKVLLNSMHDSKDTFDAMIKSITLLVFMCISILIIYTLLCAVMNEPPGEIGMLNILYKLINLG